MFVFKIQTFQYLRDLLSLSLSRSLSNPAVRLKNSSTDLRKYNMVSSIKP